MHVPGTRDQEKRLLLTVAAANYDMDSPGQLESARLGEPVRCSTSAPPDPIPGGMQCSWQHVQLQGTAWRPQQANHSSHYLVLTPFCLLIIHPPWPIRPPPPPPIACSRCCCCSCPATARGQAQPPPAAAAWRRAHRQLLLVRRRPVGGRVAGAAVLAAWPWSAGWGLSTYNVCIGWVGGGTDRLAWRKQGVVCCFINVHVECVVNARCNLSPGRLPLPPAHTIGTLGKTGRTSR